MSSFLVNKLDRSFLFSRLNTIYLLQLQTPALSRYPKEFYCVQSVSSQSDGFSTPSLSNRQSSPCSAISSKDNSQPLRTASARRRIISLSPRIISPLFHFCYLDSASFTQSFITSPLPTGA